MLFRPYLVSVLFASGVLGLGLVVGTVVVDEPVVTPGAVFTPAVFLSPIFQNIMPRPRATATAAAIA
jgi:hypothetical protein